MEIYYCRSFIQCRKKHGGEDRGREGRSREGGRQRLGEREKGEGGFKWGFPISGDNGPARHHKITK